MPYRLNPDNIPTSPSLPYQSGTLDAALNTWAQNSFFNFFTLFRELVRLRPIIITDQEYTNLPYAAQQFFVQTYETPVPTLTAEDVHTLQTMMAERRMQRDILQQQMRELPPAPPPRAGRHSNVGDTEPEDL